MLVKLRTLFDLQVHQFETPDLYTKIRLQVPTHGIFNFGVGLLSPKGDNCPEKSGLTFKNVRIVGRQVNISV